MCKGLFAQHHWCQYPHKVFTPSEKSHLLSSNQCHVLKCNICSESTLRVVWNMWRPICRSTRYSTMPKDIFLNDSSDLVTGIGCNILQNQKIKNLNWKLKLSSTIGLRSNEMAEKQWGRSLILQGVSSYKFPTNIKRLIWRDCLLRIRKHFYKKRLWFKDKITIVLSLSLSNNHFLFPANCRGPVWRRGRRKRK